VKSDPSPQLRWHRNNRPRSLQNMRARALMRRYGITTEEFDAVLHMQDGCCAVCQRKVSIFSGTGSNDKSNAACVDHNHSTGEARGILCGDCNRAIGLLRESSAIVEAAATYLQESKS
jgi:hypothetical protein